MPTDNDTKAPEAPRRKRFALKEHSAALDPVFDAVRDDLADVELADRVFAPHYAKAMRYLAITDLTVYMKPDIATDIVDTLTKGSALDVFDLSGGWGWVRTANGVGYTHAEGISPQ